MTSQLEPKESREFDFSYPLRIAQLLMFEQVLPDQRVAFGHWRQGADKTSTVIDSTTQPICHSTSMPLSAAVVPQFFPAL